MARKCFFSFHYLPDNWRAAQVRGIGAIEGNQPAKDNDWEEVVGGGDSKIQEWIDNQMAGRTCALILVGENTADRKWIDYEIKKAWSLGLGVAGIYIHGLKDSSGYTSNQGRNPFSKFTLGTESFDSVVKCYNPAGSDSKAKYSWISENIESIIEEAIKTRASYK